MHIKTLRNDLERYLIEHSLVKKWQKAKALLEQNPAHPSLNVELLEPRWRGIYSLRLDRKYRALFFISDGTVEIFQITNHYKK